MKDSLNDIHLNILWLNPDNNPEHRIDAVDYTHCSIANQVASYSTIDHFAMSDRLFAAVSEAGVIHSGENMSNHSATYSKLKVGTLDLTVESVTPQQRSCWTKANEDAKANFKTTLASKLGEIHHLPVYA